MKNSATGALLAVLGVILAVVLVAAVGVGVWYLGWGVHRANVNKDYEVNRESSGYQQSLISAERDRVTAWETADGGQKVAIGQQFCAVYPNLTAKPVDLAAAAASIGCP